MWIAGEKHEVVLDDKRCDPHIICRDWCALLTQLIEDLTKKSNGLGRGIQDRDTWTVEESIEYLFILAGLCPKQESGSELGQRDEREIEAFSSSHVLNSDRFVIAEVPISTGVDYRIHDQDS